MAGYVAAYRVGMLVSGAGVVGLTAWLETRGLRQGRGVAHRLLRCGAAGAGRAAGRAVCARAEGAVAAGERGAQVGCAGARAVDGPRTPSPDFLSRDAALAVLAFCRALQAVRCAGRRHDRAVRAGRLGYDKATYAAIVKGLGLAAAADRRLCRRRRGARAAARHGAVARRHPADGLQPGVRVALAISRRAPGR